MGQQMIKSLFKYDKVLRLNKAPATHVPRAGEGGESVDFHPTACAEAFVDPSSTEIFRISTSQSPDKIGVSFIIY